MRGALSTALALCLSTQVAFAEKRIIGDWLVNRESDPFSDTEQEKVIAMRANSSGDMLALRCLGGQISLALGGPTYTAGDFFMVKFRADKNTVVVTAAAAISSKVLEIVAKREMVEQMLTAHEYALRLIGNAQTDYVFRAGRGADRALAEVVKACR